MIRLTRLNGTPLYLNSDLIEHIDATPDTVVTLTSGPKFMVTETPEEVCQKVVEFRRSLLNLSTSMQDEQSPHSAPVNVAHG